MRRDEPEHLLIGVNEAARLLSICPRNLRGRSAPKGPIPCVRIGGALRYSPAALAAWIASQLTPQLTEQV